MIFRLALLLFLGFIAWRIWRGWLLRQQGSAPTATPPTGFSAEQDQMVRCEQCGIRVPASQVAAIRANCKKCSA